MIIQSTLRFRDGNKYETKLACMNSLILMLFPPIALDSTEQVVIIPRSRNTGARWLSIRILRIPTESNIEYRLATIHASNGTLYSNAI